MSSSFWDDAFLTVVHLINRMPSETINMVSSFEKIDMKQPDYSSLKVFGCLCHPLIRPYNSNKLQFRSQAATILSYNSFHKGYKALLSHGRLIISKDIIFDETSFLLETPLSKNNTKPHVSHLVPTPILTSIPTVAPPLSFTPSSSADVPSGNPSSPPNTLTPAIVNDTNDFQPTSPETPVNEVLHSLESTNDITPISNSQISTPSSPAPCHKMITRGKVGIFKPKIFVITLPDVLPRSALAALFISHWKQAMLEEFLALFKNKT